MRLMSSERGEGTPSGSEEEEFGEPGGAALAPAPAALDPAAAGRAWDWALEEFGPEGLPGPARALATA